MEFKEYSDRANNTAEHGDNMLYPVLGLCGEAGEVAEKFKKLIRDKKVKDWVDIKPEDAEAIEKECGDVLWYLNRLLTLLGSGLGKAAEVNITKLESRKARGVLSGSGDNR
jgi:NTP pyrophosphatase (non-canonical NTP hydrolase)